MRDEWLVFLWRHRGKLLGLLLGFAGGWFLIHYGLVKTLIIVAMTVAGLLLGWRFDGDGPRIDVERVRRRWFDR